jgi:hypothetical protein
MRFLGIVINFLPKPIKKNKLMLVINTRHQTNIIAESEIKSPRMAVKPNKITATCS